MDHIFQRGSAMGFQQAIRLWAPGYLQRTWRTRVFSEKEDQMLWTFASYWSSKSAASFYDLGNRKNQSTELTIYTSFWSNILKSLATIPTDAKSLRAKGVYLLTSISFHKEPEFFPVRSIAYIHWVLLCLVTTYLPYSIAKHNSHHTSPHGKKKDICLSPHMTRSETHELYHYILANVERYPWSWKKS